MFLVKMQREFGVIVVFNILYVLHLCFREFKVVSSRSIRTISENPFQENSKASNLQKFTKKIEICRNLQKKLKFVESYNKLNLEKLPKEPPQFQNFKFTKKRRQSAMIG